VQNSGKKSCVAAEASAFVLDSFALLAYLEGEAGKPIVQALLADAAAGTHTVYLSLINLGEALYIIERERGLAPAQRALAAVDQLPVKIVPVSRATVLAAAHLKARFPIAYADAFAIVAARDHAATVVTGDREFEPVAQAGLVNVRWISRK
jgi:predicted nucleic acid-binding protein